MLLEKELEKIGLSDKEAKIYLATLELGQDSVQNIANKAEVNRATAYSVLESLQAKGLVSTADEGKKTYYLATSPDYLSAQFEIKKKEIEETQNHFQRLLPELSSLHNRKKNRPVVKYFEGKKGILSCIDEFSRSFEDANEPLRTAYDRDKLLELFTEEERSLYSHFRTAKNIRSKVLYNTSEKNILRGKLGDRIRIDRKDYPLSGDIALYGEYMRISSLGKPLSSLLIKDKNIVETFKSLFDMAWETALRRFIDEKKKEKPE